MASETFLVYCATKEQAEHEVDVYAQQLVSRNLQNKFGVSKRRQGSGYAVYVTEYGK